MRGHRSFANLHRTDCNDARCLTGVTDSISGAIFRTYDGLNHVLSETTPQGSVAYTYDLEERA
jgi:hypothetical protein